jgi:hypothetical protein
MLAIEIAAGILLALFILTFRQPILKLLSYALAFSLTLALITFIVVGLAPHPSLSPQEQACPIAEWPCASAPDPLPEPLASFPGRLAGAMGSIGAALVITVIGAHAINRRRRKNRSPAQP